MMKPQILAATLLLVLSLLVRGEDLAPEGKFLGQRSDTSGEGESSSNTPAHKIEVDCEEDFCKMVALPSSEGVPNNQGAGYWIDLCTGICKKEFFYKASTGGYTLGRNGLEIEKVSLNDHKSSDEISFRNGGTDYQADRKTNRFLFAWDDGASYDGFWSAVVDEDGINGEVPATITWQYQPIHDKFVIKPVSGVPPVKDGNVTLVDIAPADITPADSG